MQRHLWSITEMNGFDLALEHAEDYTKKKKIVDNYKKVSAALLKKNSPGIRRRDLAKPSAIHNQYIHETILFCR